MGALRSLLYLTILSWKPVHMYNTNRNTCLKPTQAAMVCNYYDNPNLVEFIQRRYGGTRSSHQRVIVEQVPLIATRNDIFFGEEPRQENILKDINFGYLNQPISSMTDLVDMASEEIGAPFQPTERPQAPAAWKMDDMKALMATAPKVLPDIMLGHEQREVPSVARRPRPAVLDENEENLGRFVVNDAPRIPDMMETENSELTQEAKDINNVELEENKYISQPMQYSNVPTLMMDNVVPRKEKQQDFMEELYKIKLALALAQAEARARAEEQVTAAPEETTLQKTLMEGDLEEEDFPEDHGDAPVLTGGVDLGAAEEYSSAAAPESHHDQNGVLGTFPDEEDDAPSEKSHSLDNEIEKDMDEYIESVIKSGIRRLERTDPPPASSNDEVPVETSTERAVVAVTTADSTPDSPVSSSQFPVTLPVNEKRRKNRKSSKKKKSSKLDTATENPEVGKTKVVEESQAEEKLKIKADEASNVTKRKSKRRKSSKNKKSSKPDTSTLAVPEEEMPLENPVETTTEISTEPPVSSKDKKSSKSKKKSKISTRLSENSDTLLDGLLSVM